VKKKNNKRNIASILYSDGLSEKIMDCSKFVTPRENLISREELAKRARYRFITGAEFDPEDEEQEQAEELTEELAAKMKSELITNDMNMIKKGQYVRINIKGIRFSNYKSFNEKPIIVNFHDYKEENLGYNLVRFKRHRWYRSLLKSYDPLIISAGFRRFQSIPVFVQKDQSDRMRFLKYTPQFDYTYLVIYGPYLAHNTGIVAMQSLNDRLKKFRISGTGVVTGFAAHYEVKKKLKLIGEPFNILKNTCFVKGMFNSKLEASKFIGAKIKTVSGIRGQIKKTIKEGQDGAYRATFEDKVLKSDIVICRTWYSLTLEKFYNPLVTFDDNRLMRTTWEMRRKYGITINKGSGYLPIERKAKAFTPLIIPKKLEAELPFKSREKMMSDKQKKERMKSEGK